jgi:hypothetical protein
MVQQIPATEIIYPDNDGNSMSDNTEQFKWIVTIKENLELSKTRLYPHGREAEEQQRAFRR